MSEEKMDKNILSSEPVLPVSDSAYEAFPVPDPTQEAFPAPVSVKEEKPKKKLSKRKAAEEKAVSSPEVSPMVSSDNTTLDMFALSFRSDDVSTVVPSAKGIDFKVPYASLQDTQEAIALLRENAFVTLACNAGLETPQKTLQIRQIYTLLTEEVAARSYLFEQQQQHLKDYYSRLGGLIMGTQEAADILLLDCQNEKEYQSLMESGLKYAPEIWGKLISTPSLPQEIIRPNPMVVLEQMRLDMASIARRLEEQPAINIPAPASSNEPLEESLDDLKETLAEVLLGVRGVEKHSAMASPTSEGQIEFFEKKLDAALEKNDLALRQHVEKLVQTMSHHPELDALQQQLEKLVQVMSSHSAPVAEPVYESAPVREPELVPHRPAPTSSPFPGFDIPDNPEPEMDFPDTPEVQEPQMPFTVPPAPLEDPITKRMQGLPSMTFPAPAARPAGVKPPEEDDAI